MRDYFQTPLAIGDWIVVAGNAFKNPDSAELNVCKIVNSGNHYIWVTNLRGKQFSIKNPARRVIKFEVCQDYIDKWEEQLSQNTPF